MRFDDMLTTLLAQPDDSEDARIALWRQLVDLLAQDRFDEDDSLGDRALDMIAYLRATVPSQIRYETARAFAGRSVSAATIALFADEPASVISPMIANAQLSAEQWLALLPTLTSTVRALMRHRRDLPSNVVRALDSFGPSDLVIAGISRPVANDLEPKPAAEEFAEVDKMETL
ncbi:MAG: sensor histidine kinase, partial [Sphingomonadaceae bacterium]